MLGFEAVVFHVFDFIHALVDSSKFKAVVKTHLERLLYFLLVYMEITEDQVCTRGKSFKLCACVGMDRWLIAEFCVWS